MIATGDGDDAGDDDATTGLSGAESDYYMDLEEAYPAKNKPLTHLGEFTMIKGISQELFDGAGGVPGIGKYMTIFGMTSTQENRFTFKGTININTADHPVIAAILPVEDRNQGRELGDVVGPICETGDFLARDKEIPVSKQDDLLAVMSAGAYGFTMASNYNSRPRVAEVMVKGDQFHIIKTREIYSDLTRGESLPPFIET